MSFDAVGFKFPKNNLNIFGKRPMTEITWDGNTEGREVIGNPNSGLALCCISDLLPTKENLLGGSLVYANDGGNYPMNDGGKFYVNDGLLSYGNLGFYIVYKANVVLNGLTINDKPVVFHTPGVWVIFGNIGGVYKCPAKLTFGTPMEVDVIKVTAVRRNKKHGYQRQKPCRGEHDLIFQETKNFMDSRLQTPTAFSLKYISHHSTAGGELQVLEKMYFL